MQRNRMKKTVKNYATLRRTDDVAEQDRSHNEFSSNYSFLQRHQLNLSFYASSSSTTNSSELPDSAGLLHSKNFKATTCHELLLRGVNAGLRNTYQR